MSSRAVRQLAAGLFALLATAAAGAQKAASPPPAFARCTVCHSVKPDERRIGPSLAGVMGRKAGAVSGFNYSPAMAKSGIVWTRDQLDRFLAAPAKHVPGNRMVSAGLPSPVERAAVVAYLAGLK